MGSASGRFRVALLCAAAATNHVVTVSSLFPVFGLCLGNASGSSAPGACEASALPAAPLRFWLPRARKAASGLGSRAHALAGTRDTRAAQEQGVYLNRISHECQREVAVRTRGLPSRNESEKSASTPCSSSTAT